MVVKEKHDTSNLNKLKSYLFGQFGHSTTNKEDKCDYSKLKLGFLLDWCRISKVWGLEAKENDIYGWNSVKKIIICSPWFPQ